MDMLKRTIFLVLTIVTLHPVKAQNSLLSEDFSSASAGVPPSGWSSSLLYGNASVDSFSFDPSVYYFAPNIEAPYALFDGYNTGIQGGTFLNGKGEELVLFL